MRCIDAITQDIDAMPDDAIFTTRQMCRHGVRNDVDQAMFKLVRAGLIERLAWGVFTKAGRSKPSAYEVARIKAQAFGKELVEHGAKLAESFDHLFETQDPSTPDQDQEKDVVYQVRGRSSSFRYGSIRVHMHGTTDKKVHGLETECGQTIRALWHLGRTRTELHLYTALQALSHDLLHQLITQAAWMPAWLADAARSVLSVRASPLPA